MNIDYSSHWGDSLNSNRQKSQEKDGWMLVQKLNNSLWQEMKFKIMMKFKINFQKYLWKYDRKGFYILNVSIYIHIGKSWKYHRIRLVKGRKITIY